MSDGATASSGLPRDFGYYVLMHELARGGMGAVYLARTSGLIGIDKLCVIKMLRGDHTQDPEYVARFIDEARVVVTLAHRNICQVFDVGRTDGAYYLAMERVPGRDLRPVLDEAHRRGIALKPELALHIVGEVLEALDYAHRVRDPATGEALGVVHRDVSPANVMVSHEGEVKLIDFGLARSTKKKLKTDPSFVLGKAAYMAPEQMRAEPLDGRADQFAAGIIAYEVLTGRRYYEGIATSEIFAAATLGEFRPRGWDTLDAELRRILGRATDPDPARRYETCGAMRDELSAYARAHLPPAGMRDLRALMAELFPTDEADLRALLADLRAAMPAPHTGGFAAIPTTETIAMAPNTPAELLAAGVRSGLHEPTITVVSADAPLAPSREVFALPDTIQARADAHLAHPSPRPPTRGRVGAVAGLAVVIAVAAVVLAVRSQKTDEVERVTTLPSVAIPSATPPAEPEPTHVHTKEPELVPAAAPPETSARPRLSAPRPRPPPPSASSTANAASSPLPPPLAANAPRSEKLSYLKQHCMARTRCAPRLTAAQEKIGNASLEEFQAFVRDIDLCLKECR